jgi:hypothetical protein
MHQVVLFMCVNFIKQNIIQYCETWYGFHHGGFTTMFVHLDYLHVYDKKFDDENMKKITFKSHGLSRWVGS